MDSFIDDITEHIVPLYTQLYSELLTLYFALTSPGSITLDSLLNNGYYIFETLDPELFDIYCYMLQYSLFDIQLKADGRYHGAFTTYLQDYDAPYIFVTADGRTTDYNSLFHEFGHFADAFINYNSSPSLDLAEVSSQALELIMTLKLGIYAGTDDKNYLKYSKLNDAMETLISQGFYARFETYAYELAGNEISEQRLNDLIQDIAPDFGINAQSLGGVSGVIIHHIMTSPFYVQSYATAIIPSLELYFMEAETEGSGLDAYKTLIDRTESGDGFLENLARAGLTSPFAEGYLESIAEKIYEAIMGRKYDELLPPTNAA